MHKYVSSAVRQALKSVGGIEKILSRRATLRYAEARKFTQILADICDEQNLGFPLEVQINAEKRKVSHVLFLADKGPLRIPIS